MKRLHSAVLAVTILALSTQATAAPKVLVQPIQLASESIRYNHGVPTIDQYSETGSVQVRPGPLDHGSLTFNIAVFNNGRQPSNIDVTDFKLTSGAITVKAMTVETLEKKAKSRAAWTQVALAMAGGLSAAAAASQRDTYRSTFVTPRGTYRSYYSAPSALGQVQAAASVAAAGVGIAAVQNRLDQTLEALGSQIIQLTTVDPDDSYAGTIVFEKVKLAKLPLQVTMTVNWNGREYPFAFQVAKPGTPAPPFKPVPVADVPAADPSDTVAPAASVPDVVAPEAPRPLPSTNTVMIAPGLEIAAR